MFGKLVLTAFLFSLSAQTYAGDICSLEQLSVVAPEDMATSCSLPNISERVKIFKNTFDTSTLVELNNEAEKIWKELKSLGYNESKYLNGAPIGDKGTDMEMRAKIKDLKTQVATYVSTAEFDFKALIEIAELRTKGHDYHHYILVHPFLAQLFIENSVIEASRGWIEDLSKDSDSFMFFHMAYENLRAQSFYDSPYTEALLLKQQRFFILARNFIKNALLIQIFKDTLFKKSSIGLDPSWSMMALGYVSSVGEHAYKKGVTDSFRTILFWNAMSEAYAAENKEFNNFSNSFNKIQARYR